MNIGYIPFQEISHLSIELGFTDDEYKKIADNISKITAGYLYGCHQVSVWMFTDKACELSCISLYRTGIGLVPSQEKLNIANYPVYFSQLQNNQIIDAAEAQLDSRTHELNNHHLKPNGIVALLDAPIRYNGNTVGIICCEYQSHPQWSETEINFIRQAADKLSLACSRQANQQLLKNQQAVSDIQRQLIDNSPDATILLDHGIIVFCNQAAIALFGAEDLEPLIGLRPLDLSPESQYNGEASSVASVQRINGVKRTFFHRFNWHHKKLNGELFDAEVTLSVPPLSKEGIVMAVIRDVTELTSSRARLYQQAYFCSLTGFANRRHFLEYLDEKTANTEETFHVLQLDIRAFQRINQTLGQKMADELLVQFSQRLKKVLCEAKGSYIARVGGDEFAVFLPRLQNSSIEAFCYALHARLTQNYAIEEIELSIELTIVSCLFPEDADNTDKLMRILGLTIEQARKQYQNILAYNSSIQDITEIRKILLTQLKTALADNQFYLLYQPKVRLSDGNCNSFEALIRWEHPQWGFMPPSDFIPSAEATELITPITQWVIKSVCQQIQMWLKQGSDVTVALNLAMRNLLDNSLPEFVEQQLTAYNISARHIEFEITESSLMQDPQKALFNLQRFHDLGIRLAIDDFGTGYSSMAYLKKLPVNTLKIDREFIKDLSTSEHDQVIVHSTIQMAHNLGLKVVAEGIEDDKTLAILQKLNCDYAQGYYLSRPVKAQEAYNFVKAGENNATSSWYI